MPLTDRVKIVVCDIDGTIANRDKRFLTGRRESTRAETLAWIESYNFPHGVLVMRNEGKSKEFKENWLNKTSLSA